MAAKKKKPGRPRIELDLEQVAEWCADFNTAEDIAYRLGCSVDTLDRRIKETGEYLGFAEFFKKHAAKGRMSIRAQQKALCEMGDRTMLIWLGKQYLGQKDKLEQEGTLKIEDAQTLVSGLMATVQAGYEKGEVSQEFLDRLAESVTDTLPETN